MPCRSAFTDRICPDYACRTISVQNDQRHEYQVFLSGTADAVTMALFAEEDISRFRRHLSAVIVVDPLTRQNIIRLRLAVMLMKFQDIPRRNRNLCEEPHLSVHLSFVQ